MKSLILTLCLFQLFSAKSLFAEDAETILKNYNFINCPWPIQESPKFSKSLLKLLYNAGSVVGPDDKKNENLKIICKCIKKPKKGPQGGGGGGTTNGGVDLIYPGYNIECSEEKKSKSHSTDELKSNESKNVTESSINVSDYRDFKSRNSRVKLNHDSLLTWPEIESWSRYRPIDLNHHESNEGKSLYESQCSQCHGTQNGQREYMTYRIEAQSNLLTVIPNQAPPLDGLWNRWSNFYFGEQVSAKALLDRHQNHKRIWTDGRVIDKRQCLYQTGADSQLSESELQKLEEFLRTL